MAITRELVRAVRGRLAENPETPTDLLAVELGACEADVLTCLPVVMRRRARLEELAALRERLAALGFFSGPDQRGPEVGSIWFVADFFETGTAGTGGGQTAEYAQRQGSVLFMDTEGRQLCRIPLGEAFSPLWGLFGVKDAPPKRRCGGHGGSSGGCRSCRCSRGLPCCGGHSGEQAADRSAA